MAVYTNEKIVCFRYDITLPERFPIDRYEEHNLSTVFGEFIVSAWGDISGLAYADADELEIAGWNNFSVLSNFLHRVYAVCAEQRLVITASLQLAYLAAGFVLPRRMRKLAIDGTLPPEPKIIQMLQNSTTIVEVNGNVSWSQSRNEELWRIVDSFFGRLVTLAFVFGCILPPYVLLDICLWESALRMAQLKPYIYGVEKHRERIEEENHQKKCIGAIQAISNAARRKKDEREEGQ